MHELAHLAWRAYPASALMLGGLYVIWRAWRRCRNAWPRPLSDTMQPLLWMRGFRSAIAGLALSGIGAAWLWQIGWLLAVSLVVVAEETLETSIAIAALSSEHASNTIAHQKTSEAGSALQPHGRTSGS